MHVRRTSDEHVCCAQQTAPCTNLQQLMHDGDVTLLSGHMQRALLLIVVDVDIRVAALS